MSPKLVRHTFHLPAKWRDQAKRRKEKLADFLFSTIDLFTFLQGTLAEGEGSVHLAS
jgi:hypothetical protein